MERIELFFLMVISFAVFGIADAYAQVPEWVKNTSGWWADGLIEDKDFLKGIEFLINEEIIQIGEVSTKGGQSGGIPDWVKNNAKWWHEGKINDSDFINGIKFLAENGIILVEGMERDERLIIGGFDLSQAGPFVGKSEAPYTIIMFSDHQCEKCVRWLIHEKKILHENLIDTGVAKFVILDHPTLGDDSVTAAEATYCAEEQGLYFEYYSVLNENHSGVQNGWADFDSLVKYAREIGLDVDAFDSCLFWDKQGLRVDHNRGVALSHGVVGTPTFFVVSPDGTTKKIVGSQPPMVFEAVIRELS